MQPVFNVTAQPHARDCIIYQSLRHLFELHFTVCQCQVSRAARCPLPPTWSVVGERHSSPPACCELTPSGPGVRGADPGPVLFFGDRGAREYGSLEPADGKRVAVVTTNMINVSYVITYFVLFTSLCISALI